MTSTAAAPNDRNTLFADLHRHDEWTRNDDDASLEEWAVSSRALLERIEALPNTPENLAVRARAIGSGCDNTGDLGNLDLEELAAHAHGTVGRLIRQLLVGVSLPVTAADRTAWDNAFAVMATARAADDAVNALYEAADDAGKAELEPEWERLGNVLYDAEWALFDIPAPDQAALVWKSEKLFGESCKQDRCCQAWNPEIVANYMADVRRLLARTETGK